MQIWSKARKGGPHGVLPYKGDGNGRRKLKLSRLREINVADP